MIWIELTCLILSTGTTALAIYVARKQIELGRHIQNNTDLFRRLVPRIERLEKKLNIKEAP